MKETKKGNGCSLVKAMVVLRLPYKVPNLPPGLMPRNEEEDLKLKDLKVVVLEALKKGVVEDLRVVEAKNV